MTPLSCFFLILVLRFGISCSFKSPAVYFLFSLILLGCWLLKRIKKNPSVKQKPIKPSHASQPVLLGSWSGPCLSCVKYASRPCSVRLGLSLKVGKRFAPPSAQSMVSISSSSIQSATGHFHTLQLRFLAAISH